MLLISVSFPNIKPPSYPFSDKIEDPSINSKMENGIVVSRPRFTRVRETFTLRWGALPATEYNMLKNFWKTVCGGSQEFTWKYPDVLDDPYSGKEFTVRLIGGDLSFELVAPSIYSGSITLQEA